MQIIKENLCYLDHVGDLQLVPLEHVSVTCAQHGWCQAAAATFGKKCNICNFKTFSSAQKWAFKWKFTCTQHGWCLEVTTTFNKKAKFVIPKTFSSPQKWVLKSVCSHMRSIHDRNIQPHDSGLRRVNIGCMCQKCFSHLNATYCR